MVAIGGMVEGGEGFTLRLELLFGDCGNHGLRLRRDLSVRHFFAGFFLLAPTPILRISVMEQKHGCQKESKEIKCFHKSQFIWFIAQI